MRINFGTVIFNFFLSFRFNCLMETCCAERLKHANCGMNLVELHMQAILAPRNPTLAAPPALAWLAYSPKPWAPAGLRFWVPAATG